MFKRLTDRLPASVKGSVESLTGSASSPAPAATASSDADAATEQPLPSLFAESSADETTAPPAATDAESKDDGDDEATHRSDERTGSASGMKAAIAERLTSENVSAAASIAASSMFGFMKKAQSVASVAAREGAAKAVVWKNKALDAADMDNLQRRLSYSLDRSTGDVNIDLLNFSYITHQLIAMGFPNMNLGTNRTMLKDNPIDLVAMYMNNKHGGHYMIWNLSEETYDYTYFDNQVLEFNFPGHPAPPLGLMFKICSSIENWLLADESNIAAIHCLTGKGRTGTVIACYLAWTGQFPNALEALEYVAEQRNTSVEKLTIPSQRRYIQYFNNVMEGVKPGSSPLLLRRVIINSIPVFGTRKVLIKKPKALKIEAEQTTEAATTEVDEAEASEGSAEVSETPTAVEEEEEETEEIEEEGCSPYLQIFKSGKLVFTTTWQDMETGNGVKWASTNDGSVSFNVNCMLQGDILVRCRHLTDAGERVSMFRGAFHTGYIPQGILRLTKAQLDGACGDSRFDQDFFVDLIFADVQSEEEVAASNTPQSEGVSLTQEDKQAYDDMLHRDEAFWEDIEARKLRLQIQREELLKKKLAEAAAAEAEAAARAAAEAAEQAEKAKQQALKAQSSFTVGDEDVKLPAAKVNRKGSWDEEKDKELMNELESLTAGSLSKAAKDVDSTSGAKTDDDALAGLAKEFEDMKKLEQELGLHALSSELSDMPDGKLDSRLEQLDAELKELDSLAPKGSAADGGNADDDVMNFAADDFDELEEYLSGLTSSTS